MPTTADKFYMPGTEGTGEYVVLVATPGGRLGVRDLDMNGYRVRVEPADADAAALLAPSFPRDHSWKQPGDNAEFRFSCVVNEGEGTDEALALVLAGALLALCGDQGENEVEVNAAGKDMLRQVAKAMKVRGLSPSWTPPAILRGILRQAKAAAQQHG